MKFIQIASVVFSAVQASTTYHMPSTGNFFNINGGQGDESPGVTNWTANLGK